MISDEMRELLSAYVDGELRDSDVARVEEMTKRDPQLRAEIAGYRTLHKKLRAWDQAEHGGLPSAEMAQRALRRARGWLAAEREAGRGRILTILRHPALAAAALLLAAVGGLFAGALGGRESERISVADAGDVLTLAPVEPLGDLSQDGAVVLGSGLPERVEFHGKPLWQVLDEHTPGLSPRAEAVMALFERQEKIWDGTMRETKTSARVNMRAMGVVDGFQPVDAPFAALVFMQRHDLGATPVVGAVAPGTHVAMDNGEDKNRVHLLNPASRTPVVALAGEVLVGERDGSGRTRIVSASSWIRDSQLVAVTWADDVAVPRSSKNLTVQDYMLGPKARRMLVSPKLRAASFRSWLKDTYRGSSLDAAFAARQGTRNRTVGLILRTLRKDKSITGFAVVIDGKVQGVELFASHELMLAYTPRLLHGYMVEAGTSKLDLRARKDGADKLVDLQRLPQLTTQVVAVEKGSHAGWQKAGLQCVNLLGSGGRILGHGLLQFERPLHITLFE